MQHDKNYLAVDWNSEILEPLKKTNENAYFSSKRSQKVRKSRKRAYNSLRYLTENQISYGKNFLVEKFHLKQDLLFRERNKKLCEGSVSLLLISQYYQSPTISPTIKKFAKWQLPVIGDINFIVNCFLKSILSS